MSETPPESTSENGRIPASTIVKVVLFLVLVVVGIALYVLFRDELTLTKLANRETQLREFQISHPILVYVLAFLIYVCVTGLSLPGAAILSLTFAWYFGFWPALILVSFASTTGASVAFLFSRYFFQDAIQSRFGDRLKTFNEALEKEGAFYLFTLRLIPAFPFFLINAVMGLTKIRLSTFWWVSQIGMIPGTILFVYTGSRFPKLDELADRGVGGILTWDLWIGFILIGIFPLAVKKIMSWVRGK